MFVLEPIFHKTIWGGDRLVEIYGEQASKLGHLYSLRCNDESANVILNGKYAGRRLFDVIGQYPLSIAIVDAALDLSIQVHPGGDAAKYESYYFIDTPYSGCIYCGINNIPTNNICTAIENDALLPHIGQVSVQKESYVFVEPGTVHALTAGSFVYEIEQGEDNTYRMFDYNRVDADGYRRELHIEQAIGVLDASLTGVVRKFKPNTVITEKTYAIRLLNDITTYSNISPIYECFTLLTGDAIVDEISLKTGMSVLLEPGTKLERLDVNRCIVAWPTI
jgi:mannose-6-phosphate isomerase